MQYKNHVPRTFINARRINHSTLLTASVEHWKVALTIATEESNHWRVFLIYFQSVPLLLRLTLKPGPQDKGPVEHPQKLITPEGKTSPLLQRPWG